MFPLVKKTLVTKTFWCGILTICAGLYHGIAQNDWNTGSSLIIAGLGAISLRDAITKVQ